MGVVFRNGRPLGAAKEDVTIVTNFEDLTNLTNKETNHLYVTTSDNTEYYWDVEKREFVPLSATFSIAADENEIVIGDGEGGVKPHSFWYAKTGDGTLIYDNTKTTVDQPVVISGKVERTVHPLSSDIPRDSSQSYPAAEFTSALPRLSLEKAHVNFKDAFVKVDTADVQISEGAIVNIVGTSELRLWDGTMIKAKQGTTEAEFTFSDGTTDVTFSISDLQALYDIIHPQT